MTNSNYHELSEHDNSHDSSPSFNSNNGNHHSHQINIVTDIETEENISPEEEQELAGYNAYTNTLISTEYLLKQDEEKAVERTLAEKPSIRLFTVILTVGGVIGFIALIWYSFLQPKYPTRQVSQTATPAPTNETMLDESAELKSRLAFQDQQQQLKAEPVSSPSPTPSPSPSLQVKQKPTPTPSSYVTLPPHQSFISRTFPPRIAQPTPTVMRYISPTPARASTTLKSVPTKVQEPKNNSELLQEWNQLAVLGESQINNSKIVENPENLATNTPDLKTLKTTPIASTSIPNYPENELQTVVVSSRIPTNQHDDLTPGMVGILNRTPVDLINSQTGNTKNVTIGTTALGTVMMPMIWDEGGNNANDRFAVKLTQPLTAIDGSVALPTGTIIVAKVATVGKKNNLVSASAVALIYPNSQGIVKQEIVPVNTLLIRGKQNQPLIAQKLHDAGSEIAKQDLLVGLLSSLGRVGSVVNQPRSQSSTVVSGGSFNQSTVTTNSEPQIWAAALEGFFSPVSDRLSQRSDKIVEELLQRPNIQFIPEGTEVSIVANSFLAISQE
jgi:hypothetical protein